MAHRGVYRRSHEYQGTTRRLVVATFAEGEAPATAGVIGGFQRSRRLLVRRGVYRTYVQAVTTQRAIASGEPGSVTVSAPPLSLSLSLHAPTVTAVNTGTAVSVSVPPATLTYQLYAPALLGDVLITTPAATLTFTLHAPRINPVDEPGGAGGGYKRSRVGHRYPRWVIVEGKRYRVGSAREEAELLARLREEREAQAKAAEAAQEAARAAQITRKAKRIKRREEKLEPDVEAEWLEFLKQEDEEILSLLVD